MIITKNGLEKVINNLFNTHHNFDNEKQFQFNFAWKLKEYFTQQGKNYRIYLEYHSNLNNHYYDIVLEGNGEYCPIELKHKLTHHSAQDFGRYDFLSDIERIENWNTDNPNKKMDIGYVIFLTDDKLYWLKDGKGCHYQNFSLKNNHYIPSGQKLWYWEPPVSSDDMRSKYHSRARAITTKQYKINWRQYGNSNNTKYLLLEIK